jgi:hypothetical protein
MRNQNDKKVARETVEDFLKRGGKITVIPPKKDKKSLKMDLFTHMKMMNRPLQNRFAYIAPLATPTLLVA